MPGGREGTWQMSGAEYEHVWLPYIGPVYHGLCRVRFRSVSARLLPARNDHVPLSSTPVRCALPLMKAIAVLTLLVGLAGAVDVYLYPTSITATSLSASQAGAALSRHLGLEYYEPLGDDVEATEGLDRQEAFVGRGPGHALLVGVYEDDVRGASMCLYKQEHLANSLISRCYPYIV